MSQSQFTHACVPPSEPFIIVGMSMLEHIHFKAFLSHASIIFPCSQLQLPRSKLMEMIVVRSLCCLPEPFTCSHNNFSALFMFYRHYFICLHFYQLTSFIHNRIVMITLMIFVHEKELTFSRLFEMEDCGIFDNQTVPFSRLYASFLLECEWLFFIPKRKTKGIRRRQAKKRREATDKMSDITKDSIWASVTSQ